ncbi:MAG: hypothetical protein ACM33T_08400 [Solirubrobacterales bacterium]
MQPQTASRPAAAQPKPVPAAGPQHPTAPAAEAARAEQVRIQRARVACIV